MKRLLKIFAILILLCAILCTFTACGEKEINFVVDGEVYATIKTAGKETISMPETPQKDGYVFDGWYYDEGVWQEKFTANSLVDTALKDNVTLYAKFTKSEIVFKTFTVNDTQVNGGVVSYATQSYRFVDEIDVKGNATFEVGLDEYGIQTATTKTVPLDEGENTFFVFEKVDGDLVNTYTVKIYRNHMYTVTFDTDGGNTIDTQYVEEGMLITPVLDPERAGYTFTGWDYDFASPVISSKTIMASWTANTDTAYVVEYYLQNIDDDDYTLSETVNKSGTTDTTASIMAKDIEHFTYNESLSIASGNIAGDGSLVLKLYYNRDSYDITAQVENAKAGTISSNGGNYRYGTEITLIATTNDGYTFLGWSDGTGIVYTEPEYTFMVDKDVTLTAEWSANTDTQYIVEYYLQSLEDDYVLMNNLTEHFAGATDTTASVSAKAIEHFTYCVSLSTASGNIKGDGSLVLRLYYTRDSYTVTFLGDGGTLTSGNVTQSIKYQDSAIAPIFNKTGYTFTGFDKDYDNITEAITITAEWSANTDTAYVVEYYLQNIDDDDYTLSETVNKSGTTDTTASIMAKDIEHFTYNEALSTVSGNIAGDGSLVLKLYYTRNKYNVTFEANGGTLVSGDVIREIKYGGTISIPTFTRNGYGFAGWDKVVPTTMPGEDTVITATWNPIFTLDGGKITDLTDYGKTLTTIDIPSEIDGETITAIDGDAFLDGTLLTSITIPDSVTNIGDLAFYNCPIEKATIPIIAINHISEMNLKEVVITSGESIGENAFANCILLTSVDIPDSVMSIDSYAFANCSSLTSISIPDSVISISEWAFFDCTSLKNITFGDNSQLVSIGSRVFDGCDSLTSIVMPDNVTSIGTYAFNNCTSLNSITIPDSVTSIGIEAFYNCPIKNATIPTIAVEHIPQSNLKEVVITSGESINLGAFAYCTSLESVTIPDSVTSIGANAFSNCTSLNSISIPDSVTIIDLSAFSSCSSLQSVIFGENSALESISSYAFAYCDALTSITIPSSEMSIGTYAFSNCIALNEVNYLGTIDQWVEIDFAVNDCSSNPLYYANNLYIDGVLVEEVVLTNATKISSNAFRNYTSLTSVTIPDSVTDIGAYAFEGCPIEKATIPAFAAVAISNPSLKEVVITSGESICNRAFESCTLLNSITIPDSVVSIGYSAFDNCPSLVTITFGENSQLTSIGEFAFRSCTSLQSVIFGKNSQLESVGEQAFFACDSLTSITIPDSVTSIGSGAFSNCTSLESVTFGENSQLKSIDSFAFGWCASLIRIDIPKTVTNLGEGAFYGCNSLQSVTIPNSVTNIGANAFFGCGSAIIWCEVSEEPLNGWADSWNSSNAKVIWGSNW